MSATTPYCPVRRLHELGFQTLAQGVRDNNEVPVLMKTHRQWERDATGTVWLLIGQFNEPLQLAVRYDFRSDGQETCGPQKEEGPSQS